jgi:hypothetical protein
MVLFFPETGVYSCFFLNFYCLYVNKFEGNGSFEEENNSNFNECHEIRFFAVRPMSKLIVVG